MQLSSERQGSTARKVDYSDTAINYMVPVIPAVFPMWKFRSLFIVLLGLAAVLTKFESDPSRFSAAQSTILTRDHRDLFHFIAHPDTVERWFRWISHFRSGDSRPLGVHKLYQATYTFPLYGDYVMVFQVKEYLPGTRIVLRCESLLKPELEVMSVPVTSDSTQLSFKLTFRRSSILFQVKEGFGNRIKLCRDRGLNPGPLAQKSDTLPLDCQVTYLIVVHYCLNHNAF
uniref:Uncharacterized protein n=1 Tax=Timema tahoe TaxID=61484 RepID=A0A7R9IGR6_9NEOP|nr:unnamed protein product [Timema tahoe]